MANKIAAANTALWTLVQTTFAADAPVRDPGGHKEPKAKTAGLAAYVAFESDRTPEVMGALMGPIQYDLKVMPRITFAYSGADKPTRHAAAEAQVELLKAAIAADRNLGGVVDFAELAELEDAEAEGGLAWLAGGLTVAVALTFTADTQAG